MSDTLTVEGERFTTAADVVAELRQLSEAIDHADAAEAGRLRAHARAVRTAGAERFGEAAIGTWPELEAEEPDGENGDSADGEGEGEGEEEPPAGQVEQAAAARGVKLPPRTPLTKTCPRCEGWGVVRTGSQVEEHLDIRCDVCRGAGYVEKVRDPDEREPFPGWQQPQVEANY